MNRGMLVSTSLTRLGRKPGDGGTPGPEAGLMGISSIPSRISSFARDTTSHPT